MHGGRRVSDYGHEERMRRFNQDIRRYTGFDPAQFRGMSRNVQYIRKRKRRMM